MNTAVAAVLFAVANELAQKAKACLPELRDGEVIRREWFDNGIYYRETSLGMSQYDFKQRAQVNAA